MSVSGDRNDGVAARKSQGEETPLNASEILATGLRTQFREGGDVYVCVGKPAASHRPLE